MTNLELAELMGAISATSNDAIVEQAYLLVAGRSADAEGKAYWVGRLEDDLTAETLLAAMIRGAEAYKEANPGEASYDIDTISYKNLAAIELRDSGLTAEEITQELISVKDLATMNAAIAAVNGTGGSTGGGTSSSFEGIVASSTGGIVEGTEGNDTIYMSAAQDFVLAGAGDDMIVARGNGSLNNADVIDGGAGEDTIEVMLDAEETAESPLVMNVEILKVQVQDNNPNTSGDNNVVTSNIDAGDMSSVQQYWSEDSRADLIIEDISRDSHITTIGMRETDPDVDYKVYFDPQNITKPGATEAGATLLVKMANVLQVAEDGNPIENFESFSFSVNATNVVVDVSEANDYDDVVDAIEAAAAEAGLDLTVDKQAATNAYFSIDITGSEDYTAGELAGTYNPILITNNGEGSLVKGSFSTAEDATDAAYTNSMSTGAAASTPALTQVDVIFDRVGKNSDGGDFVAGSDSLGTTSNSKGIQQFNIDVDRDSTLKSIASTNDTLEVVNVENIETNSDGKGSLTVESIENIRVFDGSTMAGAANVTIDLDSTVTTKYLNLKDDATDASADNSEGSFLNVIDREFSYDFGSSNDKLNLTISNSNLAEAGTTNREDFVMEVRGGAGNDTITTKIGDGSGLSTEAWVINSALNANLSIDAGTGNDTITTTGAGNFVIEAGAGNDTVYLDNMGKQATLNLTRLDTDGDASYDNALDTVDTSKATWVVNQNNAASVDVTNLQAGASALTGATTSLLYGAQLTVTFSGAATTGASGVISGAAVANTLGFESTVTIGTSNYIGNEANVNQAIKDAINNDDVLSKLLVAKDGPAGTLVITSLIDGEFAATDLDFTIAAADITKMTASEVAGLDTAWEILNADSTTAAVAQGDLDAAVTAADTLVTTAVLGTDALGTTIVGAASTAVSANTVNLGTGDDVVVLGTAADALNVDTIVFTGSNIGNNTIVNFALASDKLDFTSYFTDVKDVAASGSSESETSIASTISVESAATINLTSSEVAIVNDFTANNGVDGIAGTADDETWANMTADDIDKALTDAAADGSLDYGNIAAGATTAHVSLDGTTQTSILMIENNGVNAGEYKVFEVTETIATNAYEVSLLGTVDFGALVDATTVVV